jgi:hypothetical protein
MRVMMPRSAFHTGAPFALHYLPYRAMPCPAYAGPRKTKARKSARKAPVLTSGPTLVTLRSWKRALRLQTPGQRPGGPKAISY